MHEPAHSYSIQIISVISYLTFTDWANDTHLVSVQRRYALFAQSVKVTCLDAG